jgi:2-polyprenyl-6-hydroxyphenyl methylase/3-demethylubiquinone-9 3-methyltransferase
MTSLKDNFDPKELAKFSALASRWWNPNSEFRPMHEINPLRLEWIDGLAQVQGKKIVDIGCGGGILSEAMAKKGADVLGIDLALKPLQVATLHAQQEGVDVTYQRMSAEALSETHSGQFDVLTCMEMLEHVPNPLLVVQACSRLVKPGGWVFFSTLNRNPLSWLVAIVGAEYVLGLLPKGTHNYQSFIKPQELNVWAHAAGLELKSQRGLGYNPWSKKFRLHGFLGVGYLLAMQRPIH